jgi:hypothetical protein
MKVEEVVVRLFPNETIRAISLSAFADAINQANALGPDKWGAYFLGDRIRLVVGNLIVFTLHPGRIRLSLDMKLLQESNWKRQFIETSGSLEWATGDHPEYKAVPSRNVYYTPNINHSELWPVINEYHFAFLVRVARKYNKLYIRSQRIHAPDLLMYLKEELQRFIPVPDYEYSSEDVGFSLPEEITNDPVYYERGRQIVTINAYERNPKARQKCIEYYGAICVVCESNLGMVYGKAGNGLIHVHHLKRIADVSENYEVDPIRDLRPVCPNCHAIIYRRTEPYSIEEVRHFIKVAGFWPYSSNKIGDNQ